MKTEIKEIPFNGSTLLGIRDENGTAWIEDGRTGLGISVHANISSSGSVSDMKARGYWGKKDRTSQKSRTDL